MSTDMKWLCCPECGGHANIERLGTIGVPEERIGTRVHVPDSRQFICHDCNSYFSSDGAIIWEVMGRDYVGDTSF